MFNSSTNIELYITKQKIKYLENDKNYENYEFQTLQIKM